MGQSQTTTGTDGGRRVACRELGEADCQGWLYRKTWISFISFIFLKIFKPVSLNWAPIKLDSIDWMTGRRQTRGFWSGPRWTRRYFVLKRSTLYGYRDPEVS